jgi:hypothetical protein
MTESIEDQAVSEGQEDCYRAGVENLVFSTYDVKIAECF